MLNTVTRIIGVVIVLVLLITAGLYLFTNLDRVEAFSSHLLEEIRSRLEKAAPPPPVRKEEEADAIDSDPDLTVSQMPQSTGKTKVAEDPGLPLFLHDAMAQLEASVTRIIFILGSGSEGNLWLVNRVGDRWYTEAGPLYCRLGRDGLTGEASSSGQQTMTGWRTPDGLYYSSPVADVAWPGTLSDTHHLALSLEGLNDKPQSALILAGDTSVPTGGPVCLAERDMLRLCKWLDPDAVTFVGIFPAKDAGWRVEQGLPEDFVFLTDIAPTIREEARYATRNNFMGRPLKGYLGNRIVVTAAVAQALSNVQAALEAQGLGLLVYDGYRPARAVENILEWMEDPQDDITKEQYYPTLDKKDLLGIYLSEHSPHIKGSAVDVTICDLETGQPLDMGTSFDYFAPASWYSSHEVTAAQQKNRKLLRDVMVSNGFEAYSAEWWHFNYSLQVTNGPYNFVIPQ